MRIRILLYILCFPCFLLAQEVSERDYMYVFTEATKQNLFGNIELAESQYLELAKIKPMPAVYFQLARIQLKKDNFEKAKDYMEIAESLDSTNFFYKKTLASLYELTGNHDSLLRVYKRMVELHGIQDIETALTYTKLLHFTNNYQELLHFTGRIEKEYGIVEDFKILQLNALVQMDSVDVAINQIKKLINKYPDNLNYVLELANYYQRISRYDSAVVVLNNVKPQYPKNKDLLLLLASNYRKLNLIDSAYVSYMKIIKSDKTPIKEKYSLVYTLYNYDSIRQNEQKNINLLIKKFNQLYPDDINVIGLAIQFSLLVDQQENAISYLHKAIKIDSTNYTFWEQLFYIQYSQNMNEELYESTNQAKHIFSEKLDIYLLNAISALEIKEYTVAVQSLNHALPLVEDDDNTLVSIYTFLGDAYQKLDYYSLSDKYYEKVLEIDPDNVLVMNNYAYFLILRDENLEYARKLSRYTIRKNPKNSHYLDTYGWILYKQGKLRRARWYIKRAMNNMDMNNPSYEVYDHYADIALDFGNIDKAITYWKKAYAIEPKPEIYKKIISYDPLFEQKK
jgi:tetratricopeptide (TPR) repeat protein